MKNMMLPAKSCSILLCALLLLAAGCKKDKNEPETLNGNVARPTWTNPTTYDYSSSMTAIVKVDLKAQYPDMAADFVLQSKDLLAAFAGGKCVGVGSQLENGLFNLMIVDAEGAVTLRYYSAHYNNLFEAKDAFAFKNDGRVGSIDSPFKPAFVVAK